MSTAPDSTGRAAGVERPAVIVFDVNETLSDMSPMADRFAEVGAPGHLARTWFAGLLRDGFALTVTGVNPSFAGIGAESLRILLSGTPLTMDTGPAVTHIMDGFMRLDVHPDVPAGVRALRAQGIRLVTLSNGSVEVAESLLGRAGIRDEFELLMSVEEGSAWKPAAPAYGSALTRCDVDPDDAMLVAIHPWDVHGARSAGLGGAWINRSGTTYPGYLARPTVEASSLVALADLLA